MRQVHARRITRKLLIFCVMTVIILTIVGNPASARDVVEIVDTEVDGVYAKQVAPDEATTYNWTLENLDNEGFQYNVSIEVSNSNSRWTTNLSPGNQTALTSYKDTQTVTLTVTPPAGRDTGSTNVTLTFTVKNSEGDVVQPPERRYTLTSLEPLEEEEEKRIMGWFDNFLPSPLDNEWGVFILTILVWLALSIIIIIILDPFVKALTKRTKTEVDDIILRIIRTPVLVLVFLYGFVNSLRILDDHIPGSILDTINGIYGAIAALIIFYVAYKLFKDILVYYGELIATKTSSNIDDVVIPIVEKIGVVIIGLVGLGYVLGYLNIDLTVFVAGGVVISMVIAFAAQETLSNFFSGIFILTDRPFTEGDTLILPDGDWYEVRNIGLRSTRLFRYKDASLVSIPNNQLAGDKIVNFSNPQDPTRSRLTFGVGYGSDPEKVKAIILEVARSHPHVLKNDDSVEPYVRFTEHGESSLNFMLQVIVDDRAERALVNDYIMTHVYRRFNEEGIEIPFPQRTIWLNREVREEGEDHV